MWRQDEDLGVGKEVYDANLRLELEKKQEVERLRHQEMVKAYNYLSAVSAYKLMVYFHKNGSKKEIYL